MSRPRIEHVCTTEHDGTRFTAACTCDYRYETGPTTSQQALNFLLASNEAHLRGANA